MCVCVCVSDTHIPPEAAGRPAPLGVRTAPVRCDSSGRPGGRTWRALDGPATVEGTVAYGKLLDSWPHYLDATDATYSHMALHMAASHIKS